MFKPKTGSVFGNGDLDGDQRQASRKAVGNQNRTQNSYGIKMEEEAKNGTQRAIEKKQEKQTGKTMTGQTPDPVVQDPDKTGMSVGQTNN